MSLIKRYVPALGLENIFIHFQFRWSLDKYEELLEFRFIKRIKGEKQTIVYAVIQHHPRRKLICGILTL